MSNPGIYERPVHIGLGARVHAEPPFTGMEWYAAYVDRHAGDGAEGRLVSAHRFTTSWDSWEMHPAGDELVLCMAGRITLHQEMADGSSARVTLNPGEYAINPPGCWHTADVEESADILFITAGWGTQHRPR